MSLQRILFFKTGMCSLSIRSAIAIFCAIFIGNIIINVVNLISSHFIKRAGLSRILNADDILLLVPFMESLQKLVNNCSTELAAFDLSMNGNKYVCMLIGPHFSKQCANISIQYR